jgi:hypothetical protein
MAARRFCLIPIKPSHYDDDGYVIRKAFARQCRGLSIREPSFAG